MRGSSGRTDTGEAAPVDTWAPIVLCGLGALALVVSVTRPVATAGIGSTMPLHSLFDEVLAGRLPMSVPRWLGLFGYLPAVAGAVLVIAEALQGRLRTGVRCTGVAMAVTAVGVLATQGPWSDRSVIGPALWMGGLGTLLAALGTGFGWVRSRRRRIRRHTRGRLNAPEMAAAGVASSRAADHRRIGGG